MKIEEGYKPSEDEKNNPGEAAVIIAFVGGMLWMLMIVAFIEVLRHGPLICTLKH